MQTNFYFMRVVFLGIHTRKPSDPKTIEKRPPSRCTSMAPRILVYKTGLRSKFCIGTRAGFWVVTLECQ